MPELEQKILDRIHSLADNYYTWHESLEKGQQITRAEAHTMACQTLQVEFQGKQASYICAIQMLLSNLLKDRELKFPI